MSELRASFGDAVDMWDHYEVLNKSHVDISNFGEYFITTVEMLLISQRKVHVRVRIRATALHCCTRSLYTPGSMAAPGVGRGVGGYVPQNVAQFPTVKRTGHESAGELCEIFKSWSFLQSKTCKQCLQIASASERLFPQTPTGPSPLGPNGDFPPRPLGVALTPNGNFWRR